MKEIGIEDYSLLKPLMLELSEHHNKHTTYFKGTYPNYSPDSVLEKFKEKTQAGELWLMGLYDDNIIVGFAAVSVQDQKGFFDWLIVNEKYRGMGQGRRLMDWGMEALEKRGVTSIDLNLVEGNPTKTFYEAYGFRTRMEIMRLVIKQP